MFFAIDENMPPHHRGRVITPLEQGFRFASMMSFAFDVTVLPGDPELRWGGGVAAPQA